MAQKIVWTVGHSSRSAEQLVALLTEAGIAAVADVRSSPWSRRHPWHGRDEMERILAAAAIAYHWLGAALGGLRDEGYAAHRLTDVYQEGAPPADRPGRGPAHRPALCRGRSPLLPPQVHCRRSFPAWPAGAPPPGARGERAPPARPLRRVKGWPDGGAGGYSWGG
ncbi:MAG: DUF488 family protein [Acidobacteriota bacterium]|nr:DUF488 family protein [Acidobacteriota bacterium]